jgi:hypothetical protein
VIKKEQRPGGSDRGAAQNKNRAGSDLDSSRGDRQAGQLDLFAGRDRAEENTDDWWASTAMQAVRALAATGRVFQAYDLVETYGIAEPDHPNRWGALLTRAARHGLIVAVGAAPSRRPKTAGSLTRTWRGAS